MTSDRGPGFRVWPPLAVGGPLVLGLLVSSLMGDPLRSSGATTTAGLLLVLVFADERGISQSLLRCDVAKDEPACEYAAPPTS